MFQPKVPKRFRRKKEGSKKVGAFYIGVHARMQCTDVCQAVLKLLRVASSSMTFKGKKKEWSLHVHVSLPCTGGSPLLNSCITQVREQHTKDFKELLGCLDGYFDAFRQCDPNMTSTLELPHNNRYWHLCEIKEYRSRFGFDVRSSFLLSDWTSFREDWTNDWEGVQSRFQQQTGDSDRCSSCQVCHVVAGKCMLHFQK